MPIVGPPEAHVSAAVTAAQAPVSAVVLVVFVIAILATAAWWAGRA